MAIKQRTKFGELNTGDIFFYICNGNPGGSKFRKASPRDAVQQRESGGDMTTVDAVVKTAKTTLVAVWMPDPTPSEVAEKRLRRLNYRLADLLESGARAKDEMTKAMATEHGWYGVFSNSGAIESQMTAAARMHVATSALQILNHAEGGIQELTRVACQNAMRYARYGHHSTSAVSNVAEEMLAAVWAEVAEACGSGY